MGQIDLRSGTLKGKLAGMVGAKWKETNYVRTLVTPTNPNTINQQGVRTVFGTLIAWGKRILTTILDLYIYPRPRNMTSLNAFIAFNSAMILGKVFSYAGIKLSSGSLPQIATLAVTGVGGENHVDVSWVGTQTGTALATDKVILVGYNETQDTFATLDTRQRSQGTGVEPLAVAAGNTIHVFAFCTQGTAVTSDTNHATAVAS